MQIALFAFTRTGRNVDDSTSLGIAYHSKLDFNLEGDFSLKNVQPKLPASLEIIMPEKLMFSATHKLDNRWTVMADITWTRWAGSTNNREIYRRRVSTLKRLFR